MLKLLSVPILIAATVAAMFAGYHPAGADPSFGLDPFSPSLGGIGPLPFGPGGPGQILVPSTFPAPAVGGPIVGPSAPPLSTIPSFALGLAPGFDDTDDISYGDDCVFFGGCPGPVPWYFPFSVDRTSAGAGALTAVSTEVFGADSAAAADVFTTPGLAGPPPCGGTPNFLVIDGDGLLGGALPPPGRVGMGLIEPLAGTPNFAQDDLDSLEMSDPIAVDFAPPWDGVLDAPVFFTLDPASAGFYGVSPAAVLVAGPGYAPPGVFVVWAPAGALGLGPGDDVDALGVSIPGPGAPFGAPGTGVFFSLSTFSPSVPGMPSICFGPATGTEGDVWFAAGPVPPFGATPLLDAEAFGLATFRSGVLNFFSPSFNDNLDAIDFVSGFAPDTDFDGLPDNIDADDDNDGLGDTPDTAYGCLPLVADTDADTATDLQEFQNGTSCVVSDSDADGCLDGEEIGPLRTLGGERDPTDFWDFYDVNANLSIGLSDALLILAHFGHGPVGIDGVGPNMADHNLLDRYIPVVAFGWLSAEANNGVGLLDALNNLRSFGDSCSGLPN